MDNVRVGVLHAKHAQQIAALAHMDYHKEFVRHAYQRARWVVRAFLLSFFGGGGPWQGHCALC